MASTLPHELVLEIIGGFGVPTKPASYFLPLDSTSALLNLCCASLAFKELAEPLLYSRVVITPANLQAFSATILATREHSETRMLAHLANEKATLVKSLAFLKFQRLVTQGHDEITQIVHILREMKLSLERLLLDITTYDAVTEPSGLTLAIREMQRLTEYATTFRESCSIPPTYEVHGTTIPWPMSSSRSLRRVAIHHPKIAMMAEVLNSLSQTKTFAFSQPDLHMHDVTDNVFSHFGIPPDGRWPAEIIWLFPAMMTRSRISSFNGEMERLFTRGGTDLTNEGNTDGRRCRRTMRVLSEGYASTSEETREVFVNAIMSGSAWRGTMTWKEYMSSGLPMHNTQHSW